MLMASFSLFIALALPYESIPNEPPLIDSLEESIDAYARFEENQFLTSQQYSSSYQVIASMPHTLKEYEYASGNWFGGRDTLKDHGIEPSITYTADIVGNPVGGIHPKGSAYADQIVFACLLKTEELFGWHGGYFLMSAFQCDGQSLSQNNIGNEFLVQRVYTGETMHWQELSYEQKFWDDHASFKFGRTAANEDFCTSPLYLYYVNKGIDSYPRALAVNGNYSTLRRT